VILVGISNVAFSMRRLLLAVLAALLCLAFAAPSSDAAMRIQKLGPTLCETTGGGKFVPIPGFRGERIDRRLLPDVRWLVRRYKIFITDGFSLDPIHSAQGEHPLGLALDIVPNKAAGGSWRIIDRLALWAEPRQGRPVQPFRWVGYDGDAGHGRGHHLHLSWTHSPAKFGKPARTVYTRICPEPVGSGGGGSTGGGGGSTGGGGSGDDGSGAGGGSTGDGDGSGGTGAGDGTGEGGVRP
jgi:hypothetical protein